MQVNTHVDVDVVAVEQDDQVTVMLELIAPSRCRRHAPRRPRPCRSCWIAAARWTASAWTRPSRRSFGSSTAWTPTTASASSRSTTRSGSSYRPGSCTTSARARLAIAAIDSGGMTNLSGGLLRGLQEARRVAGDGGSTLLLLSDGHANSGETDPARLAVGRRQRSRPRHHDLDGRDRHSATTSCCSPSSRAAARATTSSPSTATAPPRRSPARSRGCSPRPSRRRACSSAPTRRSRP